MSSTAITIDAQHVSGVVGAIPVRVDQHHLGVQTFLAQRANFQHEAERGELALQTLDAAPMAEAGARALVARGDDHTMSHVTTSSSSMSTRGNPADEQLEDTSASTP